MKKIILILLTLALFVLGVTSVLAVTPDNTTFTVEGYDAPYTGSAQLSLTAAGGNITDVSINQSAQTSAWNAFYGDVIKTIVLQSGSDIVYNWGAQDLGGWVYFANDTSIDWSTVSAGTATERETEDSYLSLTGDADSVNNTFGAVTHALITGVGGGIGANTATGVTTNSLGGTDWTTILLAGASGEAIYGGAIQQDNQNYKGDLVDYQLIVPVSGTRTYTVYAGLE